MVAENPRAVVGANNPPGPIDAAMDTACALSAWLAEHPVIEQEGHARDAKLLLDRARASQGEVEDNRVRETKPLNDKLADINGRYKAMHNSDPKKPGTLDKVTNELRTRLAVFLRAEEQRRQKIAAEAVRVAEEKERKAREDERAEREAIENARAGELGVDVTQVVVTATNSFNDFQKADRAAARAERDAQVKLTGGWGRAASLRTKETLVLESYGRAIKAIGPHPTIEEAILSAARDFRKRNGELPDGVTAKTERSI
jgi:hypothetical protein